MSGPNSFRKRKTVNPPSPVGPVSVPTQPLSKVNKLIQILDAANTSSTSAPKQKSTKRAKREPSTTTMTPMTTTMTTLNKLNSSKLTKWMSLLRRLSKIVYGIDMSLTNPGLCIINPHRQLVQLFCFRNRKCERPGQKLVDSPQSPFFGWLLEAVVLQDAPLPPDPTLPRIARYEGRIRTLMALIGNNLNDSKRVGIEAYSYQSAPTEGDTMLKELGGILRLHLHQQRHRILEIPPTTVKKIFSNKGSAKKTDMYVAYQNLFELPDLFQLLNMKPKETYTQTPHPIEDMVDALAVALATIELSPNLLRTE